MKPLFHPSMDDVTIEGIMDALSDPVRIAIFAGVSGAKGSPNCSYFLQVRDQKIPRSTLTTHFRILREAGLIRGERRGVEMHNTSRRAELDQHFPGLLAAIFNALHIQAAKQARIASREIRNRWLGRAKPI